ncbi:MAG: EAL domain-containing protein [Lachnospiraceae bacterium]|nr:EAL domain-containing protein [Lachnospiraceae bacterium]
MDKKMSASEIVRNFDEAIRNDDIYAVYQPQFNHSTGRMMGAEALIRWRHPSYGTQYPSDFIPVLEENDLIIDADLHIFDLVCRFQKNCIDNNLPVIPISVNMSRHDIFNKNYVDEIERIRTRYGIPVKYLRVEITETSAIGGTELVTSVMNKLHEYGYLVEMDDFGCGYSSLNILKDLPVDIIKLDMKFLSGDVGGRGGIIIGSIVQMAKWLNTPVIAEGVETREQADFMKSIGCNYIQGYYYSKPVPEKEFLEMSRQIEHEKMTRALSLIENINAGKFWDPESLETLIFSNFVGGAAIFTYKKGDINILRVNEKYLEEVGMNQSEQDIIHSNIWDTFEDESKAIYEDTIKRAISTGDEERCETWRTFVTDCCGEDKICIRSYMRVIGKAADQYLIYCMVHNITAERKNFAALYDSERRFRFASEQANMYAWEYMIDTKEMRPCFRCMRDLGLPPLVKNYPEPAIEAGIFPSDYADMYRDWHRQLEQGVKELEAIIPLTVSRTPFHVRYTTEFDENGKPFKAYGSATLVVEDD